MKTQHDPQLVFTNVLQRRFAELKSQDPGYSLRRFGKALKQHPAALSQMFSGKRNVSYKLAKQILERSGVDMRSISEVESAFNNEDMALSEQAENDSSLTYRRSALGLAEYDLVAEWQYYAVLSLASTTAFKDDPEWVGARLGIAKKVAKKALQQLEVFGLLVRDKSNKLVSSGVNVCSTDGIANLALRARHHANLESAKRSIMADPLDLRDFTFVTLASNPKKLPEARSRIRKFLNELSDFMEAGEKTEVFEICLQLFPRSLIQKQSKKRTKS